MRTAKAILAVCAVGLIFSSAHAAQAPKSALEAARGAVLVGCLDVVEYGQSLDKVSGELRLTPATEPELIGMAGEGEVWNVGSPEGKVVVISHGGPSRACTVFVFGVDGDPIKADLNVWLTQDGGPFKEETISENSPPGSTGYRWERGETDIAAVLSVNTVKDRADAPTFAASVFLTK